MDLTQFITFLIVNFAFTLTLWLWNRSESRTDTRAITALISGIQLEMKDFHTRLATQDLEFKMRLAAIEERNRGGK